MMAADRENISLSLEAIGTNELADAARALASARRIYLIGQRSLFPAAFYVHYACSMFRENLVLLDGNGGTFADGLRGINEHDAVLVYSFDPYSRGTIAAAEYAAGRGAAVIAVTDSLVSPLAAITRHLLLVATDTPAMFRSIVPAMTVSQVLVAQILAQGGQEALSRVTEREQQLERFGAYWTEADRVSPADQESEADAGFNADDPPAFERGQT
jgi:DNA-binding MurR/RpiR family transcriptional regulator